jgi:serine/threonine-protein kinase
VLGGRYEIHRKIARGGMAEVYLARDRSLDRPVAVKVLFSEFATDPAFVERFRREAQAAANLSHPNICGVYDWGNEDGTYFIVMEYVDGRSLAEIMRDEGPLHPRRAAEIAFEVGGALGFAHSKGVVHRDVKPGNVLISGNGTAKVVDFGIARALSSPSEELTQAGSVMGTATYFSPEQAQGFPVDARSDLYSLGVVLFEMVTGRPPFNGDSPVAIAYKHVQESPPRPSSLVSGLPAGLEAIIGKLLAKHPDNRYRSAEDLRADLRRFLDDATPLALEEQQGARTRVVAPVAAPDPGATQVAVPVTAAPVAAAVEEEHYDDEDYEDEPPRRTGLFVALLLVLLAVAGGLVWWLVSSVDDGNEAAALVEVPRVVGEDRATAQQMLEAEDFEVSFVERPDATVTIDHVIEQNPTAGDQRPKGDTLDLTISTGPEEVQFTANLVGMAQADATKTLEDLNLVVKPVEVPSDTMEAGRVVGTNPPAGATLKSGETVELQVSTGPPPVAIPDVSGKSESQARSALEREGFVIAQTVETPSADVRKGRVVGTDPSGTAPKGSPITILISSGPEPVRVPQVGGQTEADAKAAIEARGLEVRIRTSRVDPAEGTVGRVVRQEPPADTEVDAHSTVTITIGVAASTTTTSPSTTMTPTTVAEP